MLGSKGSLCKMPDITLKIVDDIIHARARVCNLGFQMENTLSVRKHVNNLS